MTGAKLKAGRITVELSNTTKVLFPGDGVTKGDLVAYYQAVAGEMLPLGGNGKAAAGARPGARVPAAARSITTRR